MFSRQEKVPGKLTTYRTLGADEPPFKSSDEEKPDVPRKPKKAAPAEVNGHAGENGSKDSAQEGAPKGVKRSHPDDDSQPAKKAKIADSTADDVVIIEDAGGAIVIGDD